MAELTLNQIKQIFLTMNRIGKEKIRKPFAWGLSKNKSKFEEDLKAIAEADKVGVEFEQERIALCEKYSVKDESGKPISKDGTYIGLDGNTEFIEEFKNLQEKYKDLIKDNNELMNKKVNIDFYMIPYEDVPAEITLADMDQLKIMIEEPIKNEEK